MSKQVKKRQLGAWRSVVISIIGFTTVVILSNFIIRELSNDGNANNNFLTLRILIAIGGFTCCFFISFISNSLKFKLNSVVEKTNVIAKRYLFNDYVNYVSLFPLVLSGISFLVLILNFQSVNIKYFLYIIYVVYVHFLLCLIGMLVLFFKYNIETLSPIKEEDSIIENQNILIKTFEKIRGIIHFLLLQIKSFQRFIIFYIFLLVICFLFFCNTLTVDIVKDGANRFSLIFFSILVVYTLIGYLSVRNKYFKKDKIKKLPINSVNIDTETIKTLPIYKIAPINKGNNYEPNYYLFEVEVKEFFSENAKNRKLSIQEAYIPYTFDENYLEIDNKLDKILILCDINSKNRNNIIRARFHVSYEKEEMSESKYLLILRGLKQKVGNVNFSNHKYIRKLINKLINLSYEYRYYDILFSFTTHSGLVVPTEKYQIEFSKRKYFSKNAATTITKNSLGEIDNYEEMKNNIIDSISNIYCFNSLIEETDLNLEITDNRKVLFHNRDFGTGKTTYDVTSVIKYGKIPIVISPWESNYDHDILYLIFDTVRLETLTKKFLPFRGSSMLFYLVITAIFNFMKEDLSNLFDMIVKIIKSIGNFILQDLGISINTTIYKSFNYYSEIKFLMIYFILIIISHQIFKKLIPSLIIFKKDYTMVYKNFFIDSIIRMMEKNREYILLIEDIDRLSVKAQEETFRILSSINSSLPRQSRLFCLISYDKSYKRRNCKNEMDYEVLNNKIIYRNWGQNYDDRLSMKIFVRLNLDIIGIAYKHADSYMISIKLFNKIIDKKYKDKDKMINFRKLLTIFLMIKDKLKLDTEFKLDNEEVDLVIESQINYFIEKNKNNTL